MKEHARYQDINAETIDEWVKDGWEWSIPVDRETYAAAKAGDWKVKLTPTKYVPAAWFGDIRGKKILGLASGGGQQMPIFQALGAICTVLDYSPLQLEREHIVAAREGYEIEVIRADMTEPLPFEDETFDLIFHPVSNCYVEKVEPVFLECYRVLKRGGILLGGFDNGINYIVDNKEERIIHSLPFNPLKDEALLREQVEVGLGVQFSHTIEEQIGGQLKAGFRLTDLYEDTNGVNRLHEMQIPTFLATRAVKD